MANQIFMRVNEVAEELGVKGAPLTDFLHLINQSKYNGLLFFAQS